MRGKAQGLKRVCRKLGITPAYAGKSCTPGIDSGFPRDHPRICGEKSITALSLRRSQGSPPHMRGKGAAATAATVGIGITPAYAGKSMVSLLTRQLERDHPRICGEKWASRSKRHRLRGSPPHMRGKACHASCHAGLRRITPAYAGKSRLFWGHGGGREDHPRICGEKLFPASLLAVRVGSPPHMRGKGAAVVTYNHVHRITPAYAGKSCIVLHDAGPSRDHPRICGEKLLFPLPARSETWITPAYAGKSHGQWAGAASPAGSPPHMRGKVLMNSELSAADRITPAYAGKSNQGDNWWVTD